MQASISIHEFVFPFDVILLIQMSGARPFAPCYSSHLLGASDFHPVSHFGNYEPFNGNGLINTAPGDVTIVHFNKADSNKTSKCDNVFLIRLPNVESELMIFSVLIVEWFIFIGNICKWYSLSQSKLKREELTNLTEITRTLTTECKHIG